MEDMKHAHKTLVDHVNTVINDGVLLWRCVDSSVDASVSEKHTVSIFRAEVYFFNTFLRNVGIYQRVYKAPNPIRSSSSSSSSQP
jgi:hypothetical protein